MISIKCWSCGSNIGCQDSAAGSVVKCPQCHLENRAPGAAPPIPLLPPQLPQSTREIRFSSFVLRTPAGEWTPIVLPFLMGAIGLGLVCLGGLATFYYWGFKRTALDSIYNIGLLNERACGVTIGVGICICGTILVGLTSVSMTILKMQGKGSGVNKGPTN